MLLPSSIIFLMLYCAEAERGVKRKKRKREREKKRERERERKRERERGKKREREREKKRERERERKRERERENERERVFRPLAFLLSRSHVPTVFLRSFFFILPVWYDSHSDSAP
jgi:hypothetical protein